MKPFELMKVVSCFLIFGLVLFLEVTPTASLAKEPTGMILGVLLDVNDARVTNATVKVESGKIRHKLKSNDEGQFEVFLPAGTYQITVEANGFRRFVYSSLKVKPNESEVINIHLEVAVYRGLVPVSSLGVGR